MKPGEVEEIYQAAMDREPELRGAYLQEGCPATSRINPDGAAKVLDFWTSQLAIHRVPPLAGTEGFAPDQHGSDRGRNDSGQRACHQSRRAAILICQGTFETAYLVAQFTRKPGSGKLPIAQ